MTARRSYVRERFRFTAYSLRAKRLLRAGLSALRMKDLTERDRETATQLLDSLDRAIESHETAERSVAGASE